MSITMGPILGFKKNENDKWKICALIVEDKDDNHQLEWSITKRGTKSVTPAEDNRNAKPKTLLEHRNERVTLFDLEIDLENEELEIRYSFTTESDSDTDQKYKDIPIHIPQKDIASIRMAFASCNGFSTRKGTQKIDDINERWKNLKRIHEENGGYQLLMLGGDQIYADSIWDVVPSIKEWSELNKEDRQAYKPSSQMRKEIDDFYFYLYKSAWQKESAEIMGRIPTLMMWDDHDIFDGWGSYPEEQQNCEVYNEIFKIARKYFGIFQLRQSAESLTQWTQSKPFICNKQFTFGHLLGKTALLILDTRSERSWDEVISNQSWKEIFDWLNDIKKSSIKHLLVVTGVPVSYVDFNSVENTLDWIPGQQELEDDLRDHWRHEDHNQERLRLIHRLLRFANDKLCRVTIVSGDVHVGALGVIESTRGGNTGSPTNIINQLISSAIVHPPPPTMVNIMLEKLSDVEQVDRGITSELIKFPGTGKRFIRSRNWLSLALDKEDPEERIWAEWHIEGKRKPFTKVIHSI